MKSARRSSLWLIIVLPVLMSGVAYLLWQSDIISEKMQSSGDIVFVPSPVLMKIASLDFDNLVADILWIRTVRYVFGERKANRRFEMLQGMLDVITFLDPFTCDTYEYGGGWLYQDAGLPNDALRFMLKGMRLVPETASGKWNLAYLIAQCYRDAVYDDVNATRYFEKAWKMPGAPPSLITAVAAGYQRLGDFDRAIALWEQARDDIDWQEVPPDFDINIHRTNVAQEAARVIKQLDIFARHFGYRPSDLRGLVGVGLLDKLPEPSVVFQMRIFEIRATQELMKRLKLKVNIFEERFGRVPKDFSEMTKVGLLDSVPEPLIIEAGGKGRFELSPSGDIEYGYIPSELMEYQ